MDRSLMSIEKLLASAHKALWSAAQFAEARRDQGLADDLHGLRQEVERLSVACLTGRGIPRA